MGLFDKYIQYGNIDEDPSDQQFSMDESMSVPNFDAESYATYQNAPSRADDFQSKLQDLMGKFDDEGRFGITEDQAGRGKNQKWAELGQRLAKAGFSHSYQGYGNAMQDLGGAMGGAEDEFLDKQSNKNLISKLAEIDMEDKLSRAEKDALALKTAQDDYDDKQAARVMGAKVFEEEFSPEKMELTLAAMPSEYMRSLSKADFANMRLYMHAGEYEKAMALAEQVRKRIPEERERMLDELFDAKSREAQATEEGQNKAALDLAGKVPKGMRLQGGKLESEDPLDAAVKNASIARSYADIENMRNDNKRADEDNARITSKERQLNAEAEGEVAKALDAMVNLSARGFKLGPGGTLIDKKTGKEAVVDFKTKDIIDILQKEAIQAQGVLARYPQRTLYPPTQEGIRQMMADLREGKTTGPEAGVNPVGSVIPPYLAR